MSTIKLPVQLNPISRRKDRSVPYCSSCKEIKPVTEMTKDKRWESYKCKDCNAKQCEVYRKNNKEIVARGKSNYYLRNKEKVKQRVKEYSEKNKDILREKKSLYYRKNEDLFRDKELRKKFGISLHDYNLLLEVQNGVCKICNLRCKSGNRLAVDHNHKTGKVRGLLCSSCNRGIGYFKENKNTLEMAIKYIKSYE